MIRLTLALAVFVSLGVAAVAQADPCPAAKPTASEKAAPAEEASESTSPPRSEARWVPRQARRRDEAGPAVSPYPVLFTPTGIPNLGF